MITRRMLWVLAATGLLAPLAVAEAAWALAGGATGGGGGGGGGSSGGGGGFSGGGYGSGGGGGDLPWWGVVLILLAVVGPWILIALVGSWRRATKKFVRQRILRRGDEVERTAGAANLDDGYWNPDELKARVREAFFPIQLSWENRDVGDSRPYVSDALYERHRLQLDGLEKQNRVNRIQDLKLKDVELVRIHNVTDDGEDTFVAYITCSARDWVEDVRTQSVVNGNKLTATEFEQYWSFVRHPEHGWVLDEIQQGSEGEYHLKAKLVSEDEGPRIDERAPAS